METKKGNLYTLIIPFCNVEILLDTSALGKKVIQGMGKQRIPGKHGMVISHEVTYLWTRNVLANAYKWVDIKISANEHEEV